MVSSPLTKLLVMRSIGLSSYCFYRRYSSTLQLEGTLAPVQGLLNEILAILPNIFAGILIGAAGWLIAQIVRRVVTNFLTAARC